MGDGRQRILCVLETQWDRKQLEACSAAWRERFEFAFPEPSDADCRADFDALAFVERAVGGELGRIDGVMSSSDYPGAPLAAAIATRLGLPGARPECVLETSHKYYSRIAQREAAPEAVPRFALVDPRTRPLKLDLPFPMFVKPAKGAFSMFARRIASAEELEEFLAAPAMTEFLDGFLAIFNHLVQNFTKLELDGRYFIAEELVQGQLVTLEGFVHEGRVEVLGIVDSSLDPTTGSFLRFDYPSALPAAVQERMAEIARRVILRSGLQETPFNIEMTYDAGSDGVSIIEINSRMCGQFADLYQKVDGTNGYEIALALCTGEEPKLQRGAGASACATSVPLRVFEPARVLSAPSPQQVRAAEALVPGTLIWSECKSGELLNDFAQEDGASQRYAVLNVGASNAGELNDRIEKLRATLAFRFDPV